MVHSEEEIENAIAEKSSQVSSNVVSYSIRELRSLLDEGDIDVQPDFQRVYRWSDRQKSSLIESVILGIPLPSVFVAQQQDGTWDVVDGVQRLSTLFSFMGSSPSGSGLEKFTLTELEYLDVLEGLEWDDLPKSVRRKMEQARIDITTIDSSSSTDAKYNLFLRLNSGSVLSAQELRNCMLVMMDREFFDSVKELSEYPDFLEIAQVSDKKRDESFLDELVLRFFMQNDYDGGQQKLRSDFGDELTKWVRQSAKIGGYMNEEQKQRFKRTVSLALRAGGADVMRRYDTATGSRRGTFSNAAYEFAIGGISKSIDYWESHGDQLSVKLKEFWNWPDYSNNVGSGVNARDRFPKTVNLGRIYFAADQG